MPLIAVLVVLTGPDQKISAPAAERGQTMESRFVGEDCSAQIRCSPVWLFVQAGEEKVGRMGGDVPPSTREASSVVRFAVGSNE